MKYIIFLCLLCGCIYRPEYIILTCRAYCPCKKCCGQDAQGITSTGKDAYKIGLAVDPKKISYGTKLYIKELNKTLITDDTGGALRNNPEPAIEIRFKTHREALQWGIKSVHVKIVK